MYNITLAHSRPVIYKLNLFGKVNMLMDVDLVTKYIKCSKLAWQSSMVFPISYKNLEGIDQLVWVHRSMKIYFSKPTNSRGPPGNLKF